jgi:hypothetical protein
VKDDDMRRGGEIAELARLLPVPGERDLPAGREQILKEHLMSEIRTTDTVTGAARRKHRQRGRRRVLVAATGAGVAAAVAVTIGLTVPGSQPAPGQVPTTAAALLAKVADAAARQATPVVRDDQYHYVKTLDTDGYGKNRSRTESWAPVADVCKTGVSRTTSLATGQTHVDRFDGRDPDQKCPYIGSLNDSSYRLLQSLPTNPRTLLNLIYTVEKGHGPGPDAEAFVTIGDLLRATPPPRVSAALFRAAALIPTGVTVVPHVRDAAGRPGVAVAFDIAASRTPATEFGTNPPRRGQNVEEWIFNPVTYRLMGETELVYGKVYSASALLDEGFVDHVGQVPHGGA